MIYIKLHKSYRALVAMCDANLIGKKFEEKFSGGIKQLDLRENFYKGEEVSEEEAIKLIRYQAKEDSTFNIVGKESIEAAHKAGLIDKKFVKTIQGVPYVLVLL